MSESSASDYSLLTAYVLHHQQQRICAPNTCCIQILYCCINLPFIYYIYLLLYIEDIKFEQRNKYSGHKSAAELQALWQSWVVPSGAPQLLIDTQPHTFCWKLNAQRATVVTTRSL